jgi:hypothetical protein
MENKTYAKPMYKCAICGEIYESIPQRINCEMTCLKKKEEEDRKAAELKEKEEYMTRKAEVDAAFDHAYELRDKFLKDYDSYAYSKNVSGRDMYFPFSWLWE